MTTDSNPAGATPGEDAATANKNGPGEQEPAREQSLPLLPTPATGPTDDDDVLTHWSLYLEGNADRWSDATTYTARADAFNALYTLAEQMGHAIDAHCRAVPALAAGPADGELPAAVEAEIARLRADYRQASGDANAANLHGCAIEALYRTALLAARPAAAGGEDGVALDKLRHDLDQLKRGAA